MTDLKTFVTSLAGHVAAESGKARLSYFGHAVIVPAARSVNYRLNRPFSQRQNLCIIPPRER